MTDSLLVPASRVPSASLKLQSHQVCTVGPEVLALNCSPSTNTKDSPGCNHMTCTIAGCETDGRRTDWCWQCGKNITNGVTEHYMGSSCGQFARDETQDAAQQNGPYTQACLNLANFVFILAFLLVCIPFWLANAILVFVCLPCHFVYVCECSDNDGRAFGRKCCSMNRTTTTTLWSPSVGSLTLTTSLLLTPHQRLYTVMS